MGKYLFIIILLSMPQIIFSQSCEQLNDSVIELLSLGKNAETTKEMASQAEKKCRLDPGINNADYITSLYNQGFLYKSIGQYDKAEPFYLLALEVTRKTFGINSGNYTSRLNNLAFLYRLMENTDKAELLYKEALQITKNIKGEKSIDYATLVGNLADFYSSIGNYAKAQSLLNSAMEITKNIVGVENLNYASLLENLANLHVDMSNFIEAEPLYHQALEIIKKAVGEESFDYVRSLHNLAIFYKSIGNYSKSVPFEQKALEIMKTHIGEQTPEYALSLGTLAQIYYDMGDYEKVEQLNFKALEILKNTTGKENVNYVRILNNLSSLYSKLRNFAKAGSLLQESFMIIKKKYGEEHIEYARSLNKMADWYTAVGFYDDAETFYIQALEINKKKLSKDLPDYALSLYHLGWFYIIKGDYKKAEPLLLQSLEITKKIYGTEHHGYAMNLGYLGELYYKMGFYTKAEPLYLQALEITKRTLGKNHLDYDADLTDLAELYGGSNKIMKADSLFNLSINFKNKNWKFNLCFLSSIESEIFLPNNISEIEFLLSWLNRNDHSILIENLSNFNLFIKNVLLSNNSLLEKIASHSSDTSVLIKWRELKSLHLRISKQYQLPLTQQKDLDELKKSAEALEKELMRELPEFQQTVLNNNITCKDIQKKLKPDEAAIDFVNFRYFNKQWTDTTLYAAFVIRPNWKEPRFISLFREDELAEIINNKNTAFPVNFSINRIYDRSNSLGNTDASHDRSLYELIWQPLDSLLIGVKTVYISPAGLLNRISFSAITVPEGGRMINRYQIQSLSNIRILAEQHYVDTTINSVSLFGNIDYEEEPSVTNSSMKIEELVFDTIPQFTSIRNLKEEKWPKLTGSISEISDIQKIATSTKIPVTIFSKQNASEESFKMLSGEATSIIHLATHGFAFTSPKGKPSKDKFMADNKRSVFQQSEDPLTRAGLVMAGGNEVWTKGRSYPNHEDGILTAREISDLDLRGCVLATLSACETGLGDIKGSEGVYGLQRAFKMAGVRYVIVSLWQVPDKETAEFMESFYSNWLEQKMSIKVAFRQTQLTMSRKYNPYQWAAFVLTE